MWNVLSNDKNTFIIYLLLFVSTRKFKIIFRTEIIVDPVQTTESLRLTRS